MTKLKSLLLQWDKAGNISFNLEGDNSNWTEAEEVYALGGAALIDHMLSTLSSKNILNFCVPAISGLIENNLEIHPIGEELKKARLEFHHGKVLYTIFKPDTKWFSDNQKLEFALSQMALNVISILLRDLSEKNRLIFRFRSYYILASYEEVIRKMYENNDKQSAARKQIAQTVAYLLNKVPGDLTEEKLKDIFKDSSELIDNWKKLPLVGDKPIVSF